MASGLITTYLGADVAANRPASPDIATGALALWYSTDTEAFSVWDGATWNAVTTGSAPQFTTIELGHASDTTLARSGAGDVTIEGNAIYRAGGTDVPLADGGTGASLADPGADRIMFWDDSAGVVTWLQLTGLEISDTTLKPKHRGALAKKAADQTTADYTGGVLVAWDGADVYDTDAIHDPVTNNSRMTVPAGVTKVRLKCQILMAAVTASVQIPLEIWKNGSAAYDGLASARVTTASTAPAIDVETPILTVTAGDYFEARLTVGSDSSITVVAVGSWFEMEIIE
jgi:hypothetical protein